MAAKLTKTSTPGIFRRHKQGCESNGRCECSYVVVWRHRGKQHKQTCRTYAEAREAKGNREAGDRRPLSRINFGEYYEQWIETYGGRTSRGFSSTSREAYAESIQARPLKKWRTWKLADIEPSDVRTLLLAMRQDGKSTSAIKKTRAALSALFATAVEDTVLRSNPVHDVRIPPSEAERTERPRRR